MSASTEHAETEPTDAEHGTEHDTEHDDHAGHFSDKQYVMVALVLAALTAIEVSTYYVDFGPLFLPTLFILMVIKFVVVASFFMHLKFDNNIFSWMFYSGLLLAVAVYIGALSTFHFFVNN